MPSDIKLNDPNLEIEADNIVRIRGKLLISETWDIHLDASDRRGDAQGSRYRRALVHNPDDGLTINWANDYPSGVTVEGPTKMNGSVIFSNSPTVPDLRIASLPDTQEIVIRKPGVLGQTGNILGTTTSTSPSSLVGIIKDLRNQIEALERRVTELES